jgi:hypothetical protein
MPLRKGAKTPWILRGRKERARIRMKRVALMTEKQREAETRRLALSLPPRKECPVCLFTLMDETQEDLGHHPYPSCANRIEEVLRKVHAEKKLAEEFIIPPSVVAAKARVTELHGIAEEAGARAIETRLAWWRALGDFRNLCFRSRVCFECGELPAMPSNMCQACEAVWREEWKLSRQLNA